MTNTPAPEFGFEPIHRAHAIAEMAVFFEFTPPSEAKPWLQGSLLYQQFSDFLIEPSQVQQINFLPSGTSITTQSAFTLRKGGTATAPDWIVRIEPALITVHCFSYSRWDHVWGEARTYIQRLLLQPEGASDRLVTVGLRYIDQFNWIGRIEQFESVKLLRPNKHLASFSNGPRWHCHTGWFDENVVPEVLNQLNINSVVPAAGEPQVPMISIEHVQLIRSQPKSNLGPYLQATGSSALDELIARLHDSNKVVMLELLQPDIAKRINLSSKKAGT
jgi:uncharacterized protein (TIGR04255 family)